MHRASAIAFLIAVFTSLPSTDVPAQDTATGTCQQGKASADLDVNNVRARLHNTGGLFCCAPPRIYIVPKEGSVSSVFSAGVWIGGKVDSTLRMSVAYNENSEFWPGPLDDGGNPPADCAPYDHLYKVSRQDVIDFEDTGNATSDLANWPTHLGAPVVDGDGDLDNYDLEAGDRPRILGDQTVWWVMNDKGNVHNTTATDPLGLEVQVTAFAFQRADALNDATFYQYKVINKGGNRIEDTYLSVWADPDVGFDSDDYVGSDTTLSLGFAYNGQESDPWYGFPPPAVGFDFFAGPIVDQDGLDNDHDGQPDEPGESIGMTSFVYYDRFGGEETSDPGQEKPDDFYNYQRAIWKDGKPITFGGNGRGSSEDPAPFMYPGDPTKGEYWSEENNDGQGRANSPGDRRFLMTTGPFTFEPGATQTITSGIVWARGSDRLDSVTRLKEADRLAQSAFDADFDFPRPPDKPRVTFTELDETVILKWGYQPSDNNYLDQYEVENRLLRDSDVDDKTYTFEGYIVRQFESETDEIGKVIATFDVANSVTRVLDVVSIDDVTGEEIPAVSADGTDSGLQHSIRIDDLDNYTDYYFGVQAYAYNRDSKPKAFKSAVSRVVVRPSKPLAREGGTIINPAASTAEFTMDNGLVVREGWNSGAVEARVIDPSALTGHTYEVTLFEVDMSSNPEQPEMVQAYSLVDLTKNDLILDGGTTVRSFSGPVPYGSDLFQAEGLSWSIRSPTGDALSIPGCSDCPAFIQVQGTGNDDACGSGAIDTFGCEEVGGNWVYGSLNGAGDWVMYHLGAGPEGSIDDFYPNDFEIRATEAGSYGYYGYSSGNAIWVPFEVWDVGPVGPFGLNDPSDDIRMIPVLYGDNGGECSFGFGEIEGDPLGGGWPGTDRIYAVYPVEDYAVWEGAIKSIVDEALDGCAQYPETEAPANLIDLFGGRPLQRVVFFMDTLSADYREEFIPVGNVIRFLSIPPQFPITFTVNTEGYGAEHNNKEALNQALELMAIVPNPYKGASDYEITNLRDVVRFTNMPQKATIRVFTLAGTLIKTIFKDSPTTSIEWDLRTDEGLPIGSSMYLVHIEIPGVGDKVIKFGAVRKRPQLQFY